MTGRLGLGYEIVDGDGHIVLPGDDWWKPYLPEKYWDWPAREVVDPGGAKTLWAEGRLLEGPFSPIANYPAAGGSGFPPNSRLVQGQTFERRRQYDDRSETPSTGKPYDHESAVRKRPVHADPLLSSNLPVALVATRSANVGE